MDVPLTPAQRAEAAERVAEAERQRRRVGALGAEAAARRSEEERSARPVPADVRAEVRRRLAERPVRGCEACERRAHTGDPEPCVVESLVEQTSVWRCSACGTWWEEAPHEVHALADGEAHRLWGDRLHPAPPLTTPEAARAVAERVLRGLERDLGTELDVWDARYGGPGVEDHGDAWLVHWNSVAYLRSRDFLQQQLVGPVLVPKDGRPAVVLGTAGTPAERVEAWRRRTGTTADGADVG